MCRAIVFFALIPAVSGTIHFPEEHHLRNVRQWTFGGQNAEAYFSFDGNWLTLQAAGLREYGTSCDQIYKLDLTVPPEKQIPQRISTGIGTCTCSYFFPDNRHMIYAGTFQQANFSSPVTLQSCPVKMCHSERAKTDPHLRELCELQINYLYHATVISELAVALGLIQFHPAYNRPLTICPLPLIHISLRRQRVPARISTLPAAATSRKDCQWFVFPRTEKKHRNGISGPRT
ncbi:unnamed protein product [Gongylonema pulchrum]|uniref:Sema domain-containing protein n=1 Tax=Gongylonema pulchrum TaxID=637853 RepID=A0A183D0H2_9BILA|nr:unnamed protein product [Gongylonema pulchrum]